MTMTNNFGSTKITFCVRCDNVGYGESVYLSLEDDGRRVREAALVITMPLR